MTEHDESYLIAKWSFSKIYTIIENCKQVQLHSIVTCYINYVKDIGEVIFIGTKSDCMTKLNKLKKNGMISREINTKSNTLSVLNKFLSNSTRSLNSLKYIRNFCFIF